MLDAWFWSFKFFIKENVERMERLGKGYCVTGYYAGWDKKGIATQDSCNDLCLSEPQCKYVAWYPNQTCSRYSGKYCVLNQDMNHVTFAKKYSGKIEKLLRTYCYFVPMYNLHLGLWVKNLNSISFQTKMIM